MLIQVSILIMKKCFSVLYFKRKLSFRMVLENVLIFLILVSHTESDFKDTCKNSGYQYVAKSSS